MKKLLTSLFLLVGIFSFITTAHASDTVTVNVDGKVQSYDQPATVINGRTMVPLRGIFESLGATVEWDNEAQAVLASRKTLKDTITVKLVIGNSYAWVNGKQVALDQPAEVVNGRTLVPARFVGESLRALVEWKEQTSTVDIWSLDRTLFMFAREGDVEIVTELIADGANVNYQYPNSYTVLGISLYKQKYDVAKLLIQNGASVDVVDASGGTALMHAAFNNSADMVKYLLDAGADPNLKDAKGYSPLRIANQKGYKDIAALLQAAGGKL